MDEFCRNAPSFTTLPRVCYNGLTKNREEPAMSEHTHTYKCPSCAAPLVFDGHSLKLSCSRCGNTFPVDTVKEVNSIEQMESAASGPNTWEEEQGQGGNQGTRTFSCSSCGAQLITDETTVATSCAFCGSPTIIPAQFTEGTVPAKLIPFTVSKEQATALFHGYFKGKKLVPNMFMRGNTIDEIRQLYVPYWLFSCRAHGRFTYSCTNSSSFRSGQYRVTRTRHFLVHRSGTLDFSNLPVDASSKLSNAITESVEPYPIEKAIGYTPAALSGAMANRADVPSAQCKERADARIRTSTESAFRSTVHGYSTVFPRSASVSVPDGKCVSALFPLWQITTTKEGKSYTFAINGQTGALTCNIPYSKGKFYAWLFGITGGVALLGFIASYALAAMGVIS